MYLRRIHLRRREFQTQAKRNLGTNDILNVTALSSIGLTSTDPHRRGARTKGQEYLLCILLTDWADWWPFKDSVK